jgi:hypothetical protein
MLTLFVAIRFYHRYRLDRIPVSDELRRGSINTTTERIPLYMYPWFACGVVMVETLWDTLLLRSPSGPALVWNIGVQRHCFGVWSVVLVYKHLFNRIHVFGEANCNRDSTS